MERPRNQPRGFTLLEVMITMTIVVVLASLALPTVMDGLKTKPLVEATDEVMDTVQYAKNRAVNDFVAYGLAITTAVGSEPGQIQTFRGTGPTCGSFDVVNDVPVRTLNFNGFINQSASAGDEVQIRILGVDPSGLTAICIVPDGRVLDAATSRPIPSTLGAIYGAGDAVIVLQRFVAGVPDSLRHNVIVPFSGKPRVTFGDSITSGDGEGGA